METLVINIKKKSEVSIIKKILQAFDVEITDNKEITNTEILKRIERTNGKDAHKHIVKVKNLEDLWDRLNSK